MKKLMVLLMAMAMVFTCVACGKNTEEEKTQNVESTGNVESSESVENTESVENKVEIADANEILTKVWDEYKKTAGEEMQFPIGGGFGEAMVMDAPGAFDVKQEGAKDMLVSTFCVPAENLDMIDGIATMMNMMMSNNFTCGAYHVADAANVEAVVSAIKDATLNNRWMCGLPEKFIVVTIGDYVVSAYGNGMVMDVIKTAFTTVYGDAAVFAVEENIAG